MPSLYRRYVGPPFVRQLSYEREGKRIAQQFGYVHYLGPFRLTGPGKAELNARRRDPRRRVRKDL